MRTGSLGLKSSPTWDLIKKAVDTDLIAQLFNRCSKPTTPNLHSKVDNPSSGSQSSPIGSKLSVSISDL